MAEPKVAIHVLVPADQKRALSKLAAGCKRSIAFLVNEAIAEYVARGGVTGGRNGK